MLQPLETPQDIDVFQTWWQQISHDYLDFFRLGVEQPHIHTLNKMSILYTQINDITYDASIAHIRQHLLNAMRGFLKYLQTYYTEPDIHALHDAMENLQVFNYVLDQLGLQSSLV